MRPRGVCVHSAPGRVRIRIPERKGDEAFFAYAREHLAGCAGVDEVAVNATTGSILIRHRSDLNTIASHASRHEVFDLERGKKAKRLVNATIGAFQSLNGKIDRLSGGELDLPGTVSLALVAGGIVQIIRGRFVAPAWYTAFWYAMNIFLKSQAEKGPAE